MVEWLGACSHGLGVCLCGLDFVLAWLSSVWVHGWGVYYVVQVCSSVVGKSGGMIGMYVKFFLQTTKDLLLRVT